MKLKESMNQGVTRVNDVGRHSRIKRKATFFSRQKNRNTKNNSITLMSVSVFLVEICLLGIFYIASIGNSMSYNQVSTAKDIIRAIES